MQKSPKGSRNRICKGSEEEPCLESVRRDKKRTEWLGRQREKPGREEIGEELGANRKAL